MRFRIVAQAFRGSGAIVCTRCRHRVVFPDDARVILWDDGIRLLVVNAMSRTVIHKCGRKLEWICLKCKRTYEPSEVKLVKRRRKVPIPDTKCPNCWDGKLAQRETTERAGETV